MVELAFRRCAQPTSWAQQFTLKKQPRRRWSSHAPSPATPPHHAGLRFHWRSPGGAPQLCGPAAGGRPAPERGCARCLHRGGGAQEGLRLHQERCVERQCGIITARDGNARLVLRGGALRQWQRRWQRAFTAENYRLAVAIKQWHFISLWSMHEIEILACMSIHKMQAACAPGSPRRSASSARAHWRHDPSTPPCRPRLCVQAPRCQGVRRPARERRRHHHPPAGHQGGSFGSCTKSSSVGGAVLQETSLWEDRCSGGSLAPKGRRRGNRWGCMVQ